MVCKIQYDLSIWDWETLSQLNFEVTGSIYLIFDNSVTQEQEWVPGTGILLAPVPHGSVPEYQ